MDPTVMLPDMMNTPGIYYAIAYAIASLVFLHAMPQKLHGVKKWGILIGISIILSIWMVTTKNVSQVLFIPTMLVSLGFMFLMIYLVADCDIKTGIYFTVRSFIYGEFVASMGWQLMYFGVVNGGMSLNLRTNLIIIVPTYLILFGLALLIGIRRKKSTAELSLTRSNVIGAIVIGVVIYALSNLSFVTTNTPFSARFTSEILLLRTMIDLSGAAILFLYDIVIRQMQATMEAQTLQNMLETQYANYQVSRDSIDLINQKYHDLKHQIAILRNEIDTEGSLQYLDQMEQDIKQYEAQNKTQNHILDIILTSKSLICQRHHIELTVVADGSAIDFMEAMDISSLFGNALDNAIEGVRKIENYSERLIHLTVVRQKAFVHIEVENRYVGDIKFRNGLPVTTKKQDVGYHGFGVKSIRSTVDKYGGSSTLSAEDGWFRLNILIPIPKE